MLNYTLHADDVCSRKLQTLGCFLQR